MINCFRLEVERRTAFSRSTDNQCLRTERLQNRTLNHRFQINPVVWKADQVLKRELGIVLALEDFGVRYAEPERDDCCSVAQIASRTSGSTCEKY